MAKQKLQNWYFNEVTVRQITLHAQDKSYWHFGKMSDHEIGFNIDNIMAFIAALLQNNCLKLAVYSLSCIQSYGLQTF